MSEKHLRSYCPVCLLKQIEARFCVGASAVVALLHVVAPETLDWAAVVGDIHAATVQCVDDAACKGALQGQGSVEHLVVLFAAVTAALVFGGRVVSFFWMFHARIPMLEGPRPLRGRGGGGGFYRKAARSAGRLGGVEWVWRLDGG